MKSKYTITIVAAIAMAVMSSNTWAQAEDFTIAGGGGAKNKSVYSQMIGELAVACSTEDLPLKEVESSGGPNNLVLLKGNKVKAALIPTDVLLAAKMDNPTSVAMLKTIFSMHTEDVHLIARGDAKTEGGMSLGKFNIGGKEIVYNNAEDLKGRPVGAVGGSKVSAQIISSMLRLNWVVMEFPNTAALLDALAKGQVDAVVVSAGSPSPAVEGIKGNFKLLAIRGNSDTNAVYTPTKIQYPNLGGNATVDTLSAPALMMTRTWSSEKTLNALAQLRACFFKNLGEIKDKTNAHPAWQTVKADERGRGEWYDLPKVSGPSVVPLTVAPVVPKKK